MHGEEDDVARGRQGVALVVVVVVVAVHLAALYWPRVSIQGPVTWTDKVVHVLLFAAPTVAGPARRRAPGIPRWCPWRCTPR